MELTSNQKKRINRLVSRKGMSISDATEVVLNAFTSDAARVTADCSVANLVPSEAVAPLAAVLAASPSVTDLPAVDQPIAPAVPPTYEELQAKVAALEATKPAPVASHKTPTEVSANRSLGLAQFKLAGRPTKEQFILVYGAKGHKETWAQRGKHFNETDQQAAENFQRHLAEKSAPVVVPPVASI